MIESSTKPGVPSPKDQSWEMLGRGLLKVLGAIAAIIVAINVLPIAAIVLYCAFDDTWHSSTRQKSARIQTGMTHEQVRSILGAPHYSRPDGTQWIYSTGCHDPVDVEFSAVGRVTDLW